MTTDRALSFNQNNIWTILPYRKKFLKLSQPSMALHVFADRIVDLISGEQSDFNAKSEWKSFVDNFNETNESQKSKPVTLIHYFYEFSALILNDLPLINSKGEPFELGIFLKFEKSEFINFDSFRPTNFLSDLELIQSPSFESYQNKFQEVYENLEKGNCYQINLTERFHFQSENLKSSNPLHVVAHLWQEKAGAYAHATYIGSEDRLLISNSPECLFQIESQKEGPKVVTTPIKGTMAATDDLAAGWKELSACIKNQSELDMITDLLRNDLSKIELPRAKVEKRKVPLVVNKILHQYARISVKLDQKQKLSRLIECMFPGGSITGAPKQRVSELIHSIEDSSRGFYCGSTYLGFKNYSACSINIRSADMNLNAGEFVYGAGGGITLRSKVEEEYQEMLLKVHSFIDLMAAKKGLGLCLKEESALTLQSF